MFETLYHDGTVAFYLDASALLRRQDRRSLGRLCAMTGPLDRLSAWLVRRRARLGAEAARTEQPDGGIGAEAPIRTASQDRLRRSDREPHSRRTLGAQSARGQGVRNPRWLGLRQVLT